MALFSNHLTKRDFKKIATTQVVVIEKYHLLKKPKLDS